jgi:HlyD family secretion protein
VIRSGEIEKGTPLASKKRFLVPLVVIALIAGGVAAWRSRRSAETAARTELVLHGNVDIRQVELAFNASERIERVLAEEGDRVEKGQLMGQLESLRFRDAVARAEAQVQAQREVVARLEKGSREEEIRKAQADTAAAEAEAANADLHLERMKSLFEGGAIDRQAFDDARTAADAAHARLGSLREVLALSVAGPRVEDIAAAKATLNVYEAELSLVRKDLADAQLFAPSDGIVRTRILETGDMATPGKPAFTLALIDPVWVRVYVNEADLGRIKPGMAAQVMTDSFPDKRYEGWIGFISPTAQFTPKSVETREIRTSLMYEARVFVKNPEGELHLGMPATVVIPLDRSEQPPSPETRSEAP